MSTASFPLTGNHVLPWIEAEAQDQRYRRIQWQTLVVVLVLCVIFRWLPMPPLAVHDEPIPAEPIKLVMIEPKPKPPAPPPPKAPELASQAKQPPAPIVAPTIAPPAVKPPPQVTQPGPRPGGSQGGSSEQNARARAQAAGLADLANDFAELKNSSVATKAVTGRPDLNGGTDSGPGSERSLITAKAGQSSGGVNTAELSRGFGGGGLAGRGTTQVLGMAGGGHGTGRGGGSGEGHGYGNGRGNGSGNGIGNGVGNGVGNGSGTGTGGGARSRDEIEKVFDQNKGAIYAIYTRALRENPGLHGKLVFKLTIQPDGSVTACEVLSSELNDPDLEHRLVQRILLFRFEAKDVPALTANKPLELFPN